MSITERERQTLASIEGDLVDSGPELAAKLAMFARLAAGEEMPLRETVLRPARAPLMRPSASPPKVSVPPKTPQAPHNLSRRTACALLVLGLAIVLLAVAFAFSRGTGKGICTVSVTAACEQANAPGRSGVGAAHSP